LPGSIDFDPGVHESFAVGVGLALLGAFDAKYANDHRGVSIDLHVGLFGDGLRWLIVRGLDASEEFAFGGDAAIDIDGLHGVREEHVESFGVFFFEGEVPGLLQSEDAAGFVANILRWGGRQNGGTQQGQGGK
jgi:hypothetical protein